jgi:PTH1 family peptidyl-tRNA hydrolase
MWVIVGLGNPGALYASHRHNVGFQILDALVQAYPLTPFQLKGNALLSEGQIGAEKVLLLKPQSFMNLSGPPVARVVNFLKVPLDHVIVIHDELNLVPGKIRFKTGGSSGGHNGLKSLESVLGQGFSRLRIGIGHPGDREQVNPYVLSGFRAAEKEWLVPLTEKIVTLFPALLAGDDALFISRVMQPPK